MDRDTQKVVIPSERHGAVVTFHDPTSGLVLLRVAAEYHDEASVWLARKARGLMEEYWRRVDRGHETGEYFRGQVAKWRKKIQPAWDRHHCKLKWRDAGLEEHSYRVLSTALRRASCGRYSWGSSTMKLKVPAILVGKANDGHVWVDEVYWWLINHGHGRVGMTIYRKEALISRDKPGRVLRKERLALARQILPLVVDGLAQAHRISRRDLLRLALDRMETTAVFEIPYVRGFYPVQVNLWEGWEGRS